MSNIDQDLDSVTTLERFGANFDTAQGFTTGNNAGGYNLTAVNIIFTDLHNPNVFKRITASIHESDNRRPGNRVGNVLTNPSFETTSTSTARSFTFTAPLGGIDLEKDTTYFFMIDVTSSLVHSSSTKHSVGATSSNSEDSSSAAGWTIANNVLRKVHNTNSWNNNNNQANQISVEGTAIIPVVSVSLSDRDGVSRTAAGEQPYQEKRGTTGVEFDVSANRELDDLTVCVRVTESGGDRLVSGNEGIKTVTLSSGGQQVNAGGTHKVIWTDTDVDDRDSSVTVAAVAPDTAGCTGADAYTVSTTDPSDKIRILDDESTKIELTSSDPTMTEGDASDTATFTVSLARRLYAGEVVAVPITLATTTGARLPGKANNDFTVSAAAASGQSGVSLATNAPAATPRVIFTGHDSNRVQTATVTLTPVANRDDGDMNHESITATLATNSALGATGLGTMVSGGASRHSSKIMASLTLVDDEAVDPVVSVSITGQDGSPTAAGEWPYNESLGTIGAVFDVNADQVLDDLTVCLRVTESGGDRVVSGNEGIKTITLSQSGFKGVGTYTVKWTDTAVDDRDSIVTVAAVAPDTAGCTGADIYTVSTTDPSDKIRILDDESTEVELTSSDRSMTEGDASDTATLTVSLARRLYAGEVVGVPILLKTTTGARLPGSKDNNENPNHDFTISAAAATEQSGVSLAANAPAATPRVVFTGQDSNTVQTATVTLTPVADRDDGDDYDETITATLPEGAVLSATGLGTTVSGGVTRHSSNFMESLILFEPTGDTTAPQVTSIRRRKPSSSPTNADSLTWRVTFDEPVQNMDKTDFEVSGNPATTATITDVVQDGSTNAWDVTASGGDLASYDGTVTLSFKSSHNIQDMAGNDLDSNPTPTGTSNNSFVVDNTAPSVAISGLSGILSGPVTATFTFSEPVTGFASSDIIVVASNGIKVSNFAVVTPGRIWSARITPSINGKLVTINVLRNVAQDKAGNGSTPVVAVANYIVRLSAPVGFTASPGDGQVSLSWAAPADSNSVAAVQKYQYRYQAESSSTPIEWKDVEDGADAGSDLSDETALTVTGLTNGTRYTFELRAVNAAGNGATATATATPSSSDTTAPQVASIVRHSPSSSPTNADSLTWRVRFSEPVQNVDAADFQVSNTTALLTVSQVLGTNAYDVTASGGNLAGLNDTVTLSFKSSHNIQDRAGNDLDSSSTPTGSYVVDNTAPRVTSITRHSPSSSPTNADSLTWRVTFDGAVQNVDAADFQVSNTTALLTVSQVSGTNAYDVTASDGNLAGLNDTVRLSFKSSHNIQDRAGNKLAASLPPTGTNNNFFVVQNTSISPPTPPTTPTTPPVMPTPVVSISAGAPSVMEGDTVSFTLSITPPPEAGATIMVDTHVAEGGGVAASGQTGSRQVAISASGLASFTVATDDDTIYEPDGSITATVQAGAGYRPHSSNASAAVSVKDNDSPGLLDPRMMQGWLSRFGRTVSHQVVAALQDRFAADPPQPGLDLTVAGEALSSATPLAENQQVLSKALGLETVTAQQLVEDSSFSFSPEGEAGSAARFSIWGQGALSSFSGQQDRVSLDGDVSTPLMGAEWSAARWLAGAALSHSWGSGGYAGDNTVAGGDISSTLTGIFPYGRYRLTPRLGIWAVAGYGWGDLSLKPDGDDADYSPGITMTMGAVGVDGLLLDGGAEGLSLTTTADALLVQTTSEAVAGLASSDANISRLRLGLEATRPVPLANGASLFPSLELGIRQDRGDAETGFGMELGAGLAWADPERGISAELQGRTLLTHTEEEFQEQGLAISFAWEPNPTNRGPSLSVSHAVGATAEGGGMDALLSPTALEALDVTPSRHHQFETKLAYGFPAFNDRLTLTTGVGLALSPDSRTYSLLWALAPYAQQPQTEPWQISLEGERQENSTATSSAEHSLGLRFSLLF